MKLSWFSPLPPDHTEIGNVSARLCPVLASRFDLQIYTETENWLKQPETHAPVHGFTCAGMDWKRLHAAGMPVYHIGNNIHFHGEIIRAARKAPGIVVLHDLAMHNTVLNLCLLKGNGRAGYYEVLHRYGGEPAIAMGKAFLEGKGVDITELSTEYPLFEYVIENARAVISHNPLNVEAIRRVTHVPVMYAPLPFLPHAELAPPRHRKARSREPYRIIVFGFLGSRNRRLRQLMEALSKSPHRERFHLTIAGKYNEQEVREWMRELKLESRMALNGYISDPELEELLDHSDLCFNLRWPSMGESSGTLLRLWNHCLPCLVTDTAFYSTLPRDTAAFVQPQSEEADILSHLAAFAEDPEPYFNLGLAGHAYLKKQHTAEAFVEFLWKFLPEVEKSQGLAYAQMFGRGIAQKFLASYPDDSGRALIGRRCAEEIARWA
jgi:glycosyltransferase involved in cell wall biosynthesis